MNLLGRLCSALLVMTLAVPMPSLAQGLAAASPQRQALAEAKARFGEVSLETANALLVLERALASGAHTPEVLLERLALLEQAVGLQEKLLGPRAAPLATTLLALGRAQESHPRRDFAAAVASYQRSLAIRRAVPDAPPAEVAEVLLNLARALRRTKALDASIDAYKQALTMFTTVHGAAHPAARAARNSLQETCMEAGRAREGLALALEELQLSEAPGAPHSMVMLALGAVARAYDALGEYASAVPFHERSFAIERTRAPAASPQLAYALNELARAYTRAGRWAEAVPLLEQSAAMRERLASPDPWFLGKELRDLSLGYFMMGRYGESLAAGRRAIDLLERATPSSSTTTLTLGFALQAQARTYRTVMRDPDALALQTRAVAVHAQARGPGDWTTLRATLEMAGTLATLGRGDEARTRYESARSAIATGPLAQDAALLGSLADAAQALGALPEAVQWQERVVALRARELGEGHPRAAQEMGALAQMKWRAGERSEALALHERAVALRERALGPAHPEMVLDYLTLGQFAQELGQQDRALGLFRQALAAAAPVGSPGGIAGASSLLRESHARRGERGAAIFWGKQAVNALQQIRSGLSAAAPDVQRAYTEHARGAYSRLADLMIEAGRLAEAEQVLALLKDQELFELVRRSGPSRPQADLVGPERSAAAQYESQVAEAVSRARELDELARRARVGSLSAEDEARRQALQTESQAWRARFQAWLGQLQASFDPGRPSQPERESTAQQATRLQTLVRSAPGAVGLHYVVTEERLSIIVSTARGSFGKSVPVARATLNRQIAALRRALQEPSRDARPAAQALYDTLISPVAPALEAAQARTLVLSLTDTLRYVPFAALFDGRQYLVERYAFGQVVLGADQRAEAASEPWRVAGLGTTQAIAPFKALPGVQAELQAIVQGDTGQGVLPGTIALDRAFGRQRLESALSGSFPVVHIGSHFVFRPGDEGNSFLLLGDGDRLSLGQLATLDFNGIDLLTLSACDTASGGGENEQGAEVEGLATALVRQGARSVLASLWAVSDASTKELMREFYTRRAHRDSPSRAQALREAQLALLRGGASAGGDRVDPAQRGAARTEVPGVPPGSDPSRPYAHPYYWAPFVLMGNWL